MAAATARWLPVELGCVVNFGRGCDRGRCRVARLAEQQGGDHERDRSAGDTGECETAPPRRLRSARSLVETLRKALDAARRRIDLREQSVSFVIHV
jgi:hypothetical protein